MIPLVALSVTLKILVLHGVRGDVDVHMIIIEFAELHVVSIEKPSNGIDDHEALILCTTRLGIPDNVVLLHVLHSFVLQNVDDHRGFVVEFIRRPVEVIQDIADIDAILRPIVEFRGFRFHFVFDRVVLHCVLSIAASTSPRLAREYEIQTSAQG